MVTPLGRQFHWLAVAVAAVILFAGATAHAQAWVGAPNTLNLSTSYTFGPADRIVETDGLEIENAKSRHHIISINAEYSTPVEGLAVDVSIPVVGTQWDDSSLPHAPQPGLWDDGDLHFTISDLRGGLRYQVLTAPFAASVYLAGSIPSHNYPVNGYTAPGRGLKALHAGVAIGHLLEAVPIYGQFVYEFSLVERFESGDPATEDFGQNRSDFAVLLGYLLGYSFDFHLGLNARETHGGINFVDFDDLTAGTQLFHDALLNEDVLLIGGGVGYSPTDKLSFGADVRFFAGGRNTRAASLYMLGVTYQLL